MNNIITIKNKIDKIVYGQEKAKRKLIASFCGDIELLKLSKKEACRTNILLSGPTGSGKTFIINNICSLMNIPYVSVDASRLTQTGYAGQKIEDYLAQLLTKSNNNLIAAERAVIFIDEFDKICSKIDDFRRVDVGGLGVQYELLKLLEGANFILQHNGQPIEFRTERLIIICAGAFSYLDNNSTYSNNAQKLKAAGFIDELVGRFNQYIHLEKYDENDYYRFLKENKSSTLDKYKALFESSKIKFNIKDKSLKDIANQAFSLGIGIRGVDIVLEDILLDKYYDGLVSKVENITI